MPSPAGSGHVYTCNLEDMVFTRPPTRSWILNWLPAAIAVAVIATESTSMMSANNTSHWLLPIWIRIFGPVSTADWNTIHEILRKTGHVVGYGLVSLAFFHGWRSSLRPPPALGILWRRAACLAVFCAFLVACADEMHQHSLPARSGSIADVGIDVGGAILAQLLLFTARAKLSRLPAYSSAR